MVLFYIQIVELAKSKGIKLTYNDFNIKANVKKYGNIINLDI